MPISKKQVPTTVELIRKKQVPTTVELIRKLLLKQFYAKELTIVNSGNDYGSAAYYIVKLASTRTI